MWLVASVLDTTAPKRRFASARPLISGLKSYVTSSYVGALMSRSNKWPLIDKTWEKKTANRSKKDDKKFVIIAITHILFLKRVKFSNGKMVFLCCLKCGFQEITVDDECKDCVVVCVRCRDWFGLISVDSEWDLANHRAQYHRADSVPGGKVSLFTFVP